MPSSGNIRLGVLLIVSGIAAAEGLSFTSDVQFAGIASPTAIWFLSDGSEPPSADDTVTASRRDNLFATFGGDYAVASLSGNLAPADTAAGPNGGRSAWHLTDLLFEDGMVALSTSFAPPAFEAYEIDLFSARDQPPDAWALDADPVMSAAPPANPATENRYLSSAHQM